MLDDGYGLMPNRVLYDPALSPSAKLLFCTISSLCAQRGYCYASNRYLAQLYGVSEKQVSRLIGQLSGYIAIENGVNHQRVIRLDKNVQAPGQKAHGSLDKKRTHINTRDNYKKINADEHIRRMYEQRPTRLPGWVKEAYDG